MPQFYNFLFFSYFCAKLRKVHDRVAEEVSRLLGICLNVCQTEYVTKSNGT